MRVLLIALLLAIFTTGGTIAATNGRHATDSRFFYGTLTGTFDSTSETLIGAIPTDGIDLLTITVTITDVSSVTGDLKIMGSNTAMTNLTNAYQVDSHASLQSWTASGEQSTIWISDIRPCKYLGFTATVSTGAADPGTITIAIRGFKQGKEVGYIKWQ